MAILLENYRENKEEFDKIHCSKEYLTASEIACIAGLNPYRSAFEVWATKLGKIPMAPETSIMRLGTKLEPVVAELCTEERSLVLDRVTAVYYDPETGIVATPDYFVKNSDGSTSVLEIKTTSAWSKHWDENAEIPDFVQCQVQTQLGVLGLKHAYVACLKGGRDLIIQEMTFSQDAYDSLKELAKKFFKLLNDEVPPQVAAEDTKLINTLFKPREGKEITLDYSGDALAKEFLEQKVRVVEKEKELETEKTRLEGIKAGLRMLMQDAAYATTPSGLVCSCQTIRYKERKTQAYDVIRFSVREVKN